ncbi:hypothetical protein M1D88_12580 [Arthrobacter sp. R1-13]
MLTPVQLAALLHRRAADVLGDTDVIAPHAVARILTDHLAREGFRQFYAASDDFTLVYRIGDDAPARVSVRDFREEIHPRVLEILTSAAAADHSGARRARATVQALNGRQRGAESWLRTAALHAREMLPDLTDQEQVSLERRNVDVQLKRPSADRLHTQAARRQIRKATDEAETREVLEAWLGALPDGPHPLPDVWQAFQHARQKSEQKLRSTKPGALAVGRTTFYRLLAEFGEVRTGQARSRVLAVPYLLRVRSLLKRRQYVAALKLQRAHHSGR